MHTQTKIVRTLHGNFQRVGARAVPAGCFHRGCEERALQQLPILTKATMTERRIRRADVEEFLKRDESSRLFLHSTKSR